MQRQERLIRLTQRLVEQPAAPLHVTQLADRWGVAKSTLSEDIALIRETFAGAGTGNVETMVGVQGGVRYRPVVAHDDRAAFLGELAARLSDPDRVLAGQFVYLSDVLGDPDVLDFVGRLVSAHFQHAGVNVVVTVETKGITLAASVARYLHVPIAIVRRDQRVTEGASVTTHYVSGSAKRIQTMSLSKRLVPNDARALIVDDFMRAGATARAVAQLLAEFDAEVVGTAVFMATAMPVAKMVDSYVALLQVNEVSEAGIEVRPFPLTQ
ncbi:pur operon repressor [Alicyclobacillus hesperidum URH17-3-68]|uniref:Pur operon repressor n=1 Tax=Alicyclobacillus hesperidum TaxID=89784 RepID=A0A1H2TMU2_9BACL|nr:pur operon repressor [Alicyclobacillus hesperidum]EJY56928.1 pur operon repressor [Alicyclobacillus hesperidum URH17-3-68]GLG02398.1 pur operon repressor [Alicyclobacillus hesperidum subsp. aegles]GLV13913.1 pur operon repressor [Alicyclobacillus hesperidum]SDW45172.1 purine operon repressor, PurR [Alicyclobacillus hesperidum]